MPPTLRLTYIEGLAARAFPTRFALRCAGLAFDDERISRDELARRRAGGAGSAGEAAVPLGQLPVLYVDGLPITQSLAQSRWAAARAPALAPPADADGLASLSVDEAMCVLDELWSKLPQLRHFAHLEPAAAAAATAAGRATWAAEVAPKYLRLLAARLAARGGPFVLGARPSIADAWLLAFDAQLRSGAYDGVPPALLDTFPPVAAAAAALRAHPLFIAHGLPM